MRHFFGVIGAAFLVGCSSEPFELNKGLTDSTNPIFEPALAGQLESLIETRQGAPYNQIVLANFARDEFLIAFSSEQLELSRARDSQIWLPKLRPSAQLSSKGRPTVGVNVEQFLYDGGIYDATSFQTDAAAKLEQVEILKDINSQISDDIATYLDVHRNLMTINRFEGLITRINRLLKTAETRASGGISTGNEVTLFELKKVEAESEIAVARSTARLKTAALSNSLGINITQVSPTSLVLMNDRLPLDVLAALAQYEVDRSAVEVARAEATPKVSLTGNVQYDIANGTPSSTGGISVGSDQALPLNGFSPVISATQDLRLSAFQLQRASEETQLRVNELRGEIDVLRQQSLRIGSLVRIAENRLNQFDDQFLAGSANITEAAGLIDTLRRSLETQIETDFNVLEIERELAEITGSFFE